MKIWRMLVDSHVLIYLGWVNWVHSGRDETVSRLHLYFLSVDWDAPVSRRENQQKANKLAELLIFRNNHCAIKVIEEAGYSFRNTTHRVLIIIRSRKVLDGREWPLRKNYDTQVYHVYGLSFVQNITGISPNFIYRLIGGFNLADQSDCAKVLFSGIIFSCLLPSLESVGFPKVVTWGLEVDEKVLDLL